MANNTENQDNKTGKTILNRYAFLVIGMSFIFIFIIANIVKIMFVERDKWAEIERIVKVVAEESRVIPDRGNIYAYDGRPLAINKPIYTVRIDFMAEGLHKDTIAEYGKRMFPELAKLFPEKTATQYRKLFMDGWNLSRNEIAYNKKLKKGGRKKTKSRSVRLFSRDINYLELQQLKSIEYFKKKGGGLTQELRISRDYPFKNIARRTIGSLQVANDTLIIRDSVVKVKKWARGSSGLELRYDSILRGVSGLKDVHRIAKKSIDKVIVPAIEGKDIRVTLDVDIQDITEKALYSTLSEYEAQAGYAIIMETETGEIKGISNLDRIGAGIYSERKPHVFSYMADPGSTFKTLSMMVALEDGAVTPRDSFYVGDGVFEYTTGRLKKKLYDHNYRVGANYGYLSVAEGMHKSSNIVVARSVLKGYASHPEKYIERLYELGVTKKLTWDMPLQGKEGSSIIKHPRNSKNERNPVWSDLSLPWISYGYETQIAPIYILMFYNGIANHGKMIKPFLVKDILKNGKVENEIEAEVINPKLCSDRTLAELHDMLVGVINEGTGKAVKSDLFQIAGKTGTAQLTKNGAYTNKEHYVSFCGYFPADKPKYTCMVGIIKPREPAASARTAGAVFKNIAENVYIRNVMLSPSDIKAKEGITATTAPEVKGGSFQKTKNVLEYLKLPFDGSSLSSTSMIKESKEKDKIKLDESTIIKDLVPNVIGFGARDALYTLENAGLKVQIRGWGKVVSQSIQNGTRIVPGSQIEIVLENK
ncbi:PASTA domain-containing protein [Dysgonomonas sp. 216]|uniref:penicillin-binding protein n=1 Tax=Dysgonomonas sp. 216 TaxID=2302934 RepID=UPI0013D67854|nr:penicillin-binding transpeptidase domain-containing protein [Dysgonomonas sp. 216]NDW18158.1 PASTA domain-containing protein [Dysgonomonas sp. 216]